MQMNGLTWLSAKAAKPENKQSNVQFSSNRLSQQPAADQFVKRSGASATVDRTHKTPAVKFGQQLLPDNMNLAYLMYLLGNDKKGVARDVKGVTVAPDFAEKGEKTQLTYGELFDGMLGMATAYQRLKLGPGSKIAMAETNTTDFLNNYFGGLAIQATMMPLNLLALADEGTKIDVLSHMLSTPKVRKTGFEGAGADAFVIGKDKLFEPMHGVGEAVDIKNRAGKYKVPGLGNVIERYVAGEGAKNIKERLLDKALKGKVSDQLTAKFFPDADALQAIREVIAESNNASDKGFAEFAPENKDQVLSSLSPEARTAYEAKKEAAIEAGKKNLDTLLKKLPQRMKVVTPEEKVKLSKKSLLKESFQPSQITVGAEPGKIADVLYTSGTTQMPKGVLLSHSNMVFLTNTLAEATKDIIKPKDKILLGLPLFHIFGRAILMSAFARQLELAQNLNDPKEAEKNKIEVMMLPSLTKAIKELDKVFKTIDEQKITILPAVPTFLNAMMEYVDKNPEAAKQLSSLTTVVSGGEALKKSTYDKLMAINPDLKILEGYGSTEGGINLLNTTGEYGYVGAPMDKVETKIVKENETDDRGELWVRSPGVARRYAFGTIADEKTPIVDKEGWYHTGDIVRQEDNGQFKIVGRDSFFIKRSGERRPPEAFEAVIKQTLSDVTDAMVIPYHEGEGTGDERALAVVTTTNPNLTEADVKQQLRAQSSADVPRWSVPDHVVILNQPVMPARFDNGFKRDAGYKLIKKFVEALKEQKALNLSKTDDGFTTTVTDNSAFEAVLAQYNQAGE